MVQRADQYIEKHVVDHYHGAALRVVLSPEWLDTATSRTAWTSPSLCCCPVQASIKSFLSCLKMTDPNDGDCDAMMHFDADAAVCKGTRSRSTGQGLHKQFSMR